MRTIVSIPAGLNVLFRFARDIFSDRIGNHLQGRHFHDAGKGTDDGCVDYGMGAGAQPVLDGDAGIIWMHL